MFGGTFVITTSFTLTEGVAIYPMAEKTPFHPPIHPKKKEREEKNEGKFFLQVPDGADESGKGLLPCTTHPRHWQSSPQGHDAVSPTQVSVRGYVTKKKSFAERISSLVPEAVSDGVWGVGEALGEVTAPGPVAAVVIADTGPVTDVFPFPLSPST